MITILFDMHLIIHVSFQQCNNPLTKEPKLSAAVRIVPEWTDYDNEIKRLQDRIYKEKLILSSGGEEEEVVAETSSEKTKGELLV